MWPLNLMVLSVIVLLAGGLTFQLILGSDSTRAIILWGVSVGILLFFWAVGKVVLYCSRGSVETSPVALLLVKHFSDGEYEIYSALNRKYEPVADASQVEVCPSAEIVMIG